MFFFCSWTCFIFMPLVRVHSLCWVKKWKHIADRAINEKRLHLRSAPQQGRGVCVCVCVWLGVRPDSPDMEEGETEDSGIVLDKFFSLMSASSDVKRITYLQTHIHFVSFHTKTWSATINTAGFPNAGNADWRQCFPGLTHFSEAHWHYTIDTWYDQIIQVTVGYCQSEELWIFCVIQMIQAGNPLQKAIP